MVDWNTYSDDFLIRHFGVVALPYGARWPDFSAQMRALIVDRAGQIPWLPDDWLTSMRYLHGQDGRIMMPVPSTASTSAGHGAEFLDTPEKAAVWDQFAAQANAAQQAYAAGQAAQGAKIMAQANADAEFWDHAYNLASVLALPVTVLKAAWNNPWTAGGLIYGGLGLLLLYTFRPRSKR